MRASNTQSLFTLRGGLNTTTLPVMREAHLEPPQRLPELAAGFLPDAVAARAAVAAAFFSFIASILERKYCD